MGLIISVSGIRGLVGSDLGISDASKLGMIFARFLQESGNPMIVASDSRISSPALRSALTAGLLASGRNVVDLGIAATPTACLMIQRRSAPGGAIVTASHNPIEWNGVKLIGPDGLSLDSEKAERIKQAFAGPAPEHAGATACGRLELDNSAHQIHIDAVLDSCDRRLLDELRSRRLPILLDSVNGAGSIAGLPLLEAIGCRTTGINSEPNGRFTRNPEPVPENLKQVSQAVIQFASQVGFVQDPDADRLAVVDEKGVCIGEEYTLALACWYVLSVMPGPVATNLSTSRMVDDVAERFGQKVYRTPVGETNVAHAMREHNCPVGGEGNGGVIFPQVAPVRDSLSAMAMILQLMAKTGKTVSQLAGELPKYHMIKTKVACAADRTADVLKNVLQAYSDKQINTADGVRIDFTAERAWVHIRASNTEPIIRIIAEAPEQKKAAGLIDAVLSMGLR
jgi:phosphomannomutase